MPVCVVKLCKNNTTRNKKDTGITYHQFPADPVICDRWTAIVRLSRTESWWKPGQRSVICSVHFNESDLYFTKGGLKRLSKGAVPQNALFLSSTLPDNISDNSTVTAEPSTSAPVVDSNNSAVAAEPSTSDVPTTGNEIRSLYDFPDIDYIFDTPRKVKLKKELHKKTILQLKHARIVKTFREKIHRLKKANSNLKGATRSSSKKGLWPSAHREKPAFCFIASKMEDTERKISTLQVMNLALNGFTGPIENIIAPGAKEEPSKIDTSICAKEDSIKIELEYCDKLKSQSDSAGGVDPIAFSTVSLDMNEIARKFTVLYPDCNKPFNALADDPNVFEGDLTIPNDVAVDTKPQNLWMNIPTNSSIVLHGSAVPVRESGMCRCCLALGSFKSMQSCSVGDESTESCADMLRATFCITLTQPHAPTVSDDSEALICETCEARLRDAHAFRQQVLDAESRFLQLLQNYSTKIHIKEVEVFVAGTEDQETSNGDEEFDVPINTIPQAKSEKNLGENIINPVKKRNLKNLTILKKKSLPRRIMECLFCSATFKAVYSDLSEHLKAIHHIETAKNIGILKCDMCNTKFSSCRKKAEHIKRFHCQCKHCSVVFRNMWERDEHMKLAHLFSEKKCTKCRKNISLSDFWKHEVEAHSLSMCSCRACGKVFDSKEYLQKHQRKVHMLERTKQCSECDYRAFNKKDLKKHMVKHTKLKVFQCEYCEKRFARKKTLNFHVRIHTGDKRQVCKVCGAAFVQRASLKYHLEKHHPGQT